MTRTLLNMVFPIAIAVSAYGQASVKDFGAIGDGVHDDSAAFQLAIKSLDGLGGALRVPKGIYNLGTTGVVIPKTFGGIRIVGDSATASRLVYQGNGAAIRIGAPDGMTYGHTISDVHVALTNAGPKAVGIEIHPALYIALQRVYVTSNNTYPASINQQVGIAAIGGDSVAKRFGAYLRIEDPRINGRFSKGIYLTGPEIGWGFNSCILQGGAVVYAGAVEDGTVGIHIEQGNQNVITLVDVEQFAVGIRSDAYSNLFQGSRTEGNALGMMLTPATKDSTGGSYNRVLGGFHGDGLVNQSHASWIIATEYPQEPGSISTTIARPAREAQ